MHGIVQGAISGITGGNFLSGFLSGVFSSAAGSIAKGAGEFSVLRSDVGTMLFGAVSGGVGSVLGGGNFWMGAATGLIVTGFNHLMHKMTPPDDFESQLDKELSESDIDLSKPPSRDFDSLDQVEKLPTIAKLITEVNKKGGFQRCIDTRTEGKKDPVTGKPISVTLGYVPDGTSDVHLAPAAFISWRLLASTYYHELGHVYINYYFRTQYPGGLALGGRRKIDEYLAFGMEFRYSGESSLNSISQEFYESLKGNSYKTTASNINLQIIRNGF